MPSVYPRLRARAAAGTALAGALVALVAGAPAAQASVADLQVYPPYAAPLGKTYSQYGAAFWKYALAQPAATNPITDDTGEDCDNGQSGLVWFLAGTFGGDPVTRSCTVPFGKTIVLPVANGLYGAFPEDPADQRTEAYVRSQVTPALKAATNLKLSIDGSSVTDVKGRYFEQSTLFTFTFGADNVFGVDAGTQLSPAADAGYYVALYPLLPGNHTIKLSSTIPGTGDVDVTYKIKVPLF